MISEKFSTFDDISSYEMPPSSRGTQPWMRTVEIPSEKSPLSEIFSEISIETRSTRSSFRQSAEAYFGGMDAADPNYLQDILKFEHSIRNRSGDIPEATLAIAIASDQEGDNIYKTLCEYAKQSAASEFETVLFLNKTRQGGDSKLTNLALDAFKVTHPDFTVKTFYHEFPQQMPIGFIKKILHDVVALRHFLGDSRNPVMIMGDADIRYAHPRHIERVFEAFRDETVDIVAGNFDWDHSAFLEFPELHFSTRFYQIVNHAIHVRDGRKITPGPATAMRIGSYCEIGGTPSVTRGDDVLHGLSIEAMRGSADSVVYPHPEAIIEASARRSVVALKQGYAPNETWKLRSKDQDDLVRGFSAKDITRGSESINLEYSLRRLAKRVIDVYKPEYTDGLFEAALGELGVDATVDRSSEATLTKFDSSGAIAKLHQYKQKRTAQG